MATVYVYGKDGAVYYGGTAIDITDWSMSINPDAEMILDIGDNGPSRQYTGVVDMTGSLSGRYKRSDTGGSVVQETIVNMFASGGTAAAAVAKFIESSKSMWWGTILITDVAKGQGSGLGSFTASWGQAAGRLAHATSTST